MVVVGSRVATAAVTFCTATCSSTICFCSTSMAVRSCLSFDDGDVSMAMLTARARYWRSFPSLCFDTSLVTAYAQTASSYAADSVSGGGMAMRTRFLSSASSSARRKASLAYTSVDRDQLPGNALFTRRRGLPNSKHELSLYSASGDSVRLGTVPHSRQNRISNSTLRQTQRQFGRWRVLHYVLGIVKHALFQPEQRFPLVPTVERRY